MYVSKLGDSCGLQSQPSTRAPCMSNLQSDLYLLPCCCHVTTRHSNLLEWTCSYVIRNSMNGSFIYFHFTFFKNSRVYDLWAKRTYVQTWSLVSKQYDTWESESLPRFWTASPSSPFHSCISAQTSVALKRYSSGSQQKWQALIKTIYKISHR